MRIQPHVLCSTQRSEDEIITKIMRDTIITHGHPVGWVGAVFHGLTLHRCLSEKQCPCLDQWKSIATQTQRIGEICSNDPLLKDIWLPTWERESGKRIAEGVSEAVFDLLGDIQKIEQLDINFDTNSFAQDDDAIKKYQAVIKVLNAQDPSVRGSGAKTALLATFIASFFRKNPLKGLEVCVNTLGSDTDTIATMAGALLGACNKNEPPQKIIDQEYIEEQALRLFDISNSRSVTPFPYPDLLLWGLPKSQVDFVGTYNKDLAISGLGEVTLWGEKIKQMKGVNLSFLQFSRTSFGQTLLLKYRENPKLLKSNLMPSKSNNLEIGKAQNRNKQRHVNKAVERKSVPMNINNNQSRLPFSKNTLEDITTSLIKNGFNEAEIGRELLKFSESNDGLEKAIAFTAIIVKAKRARLGRK